MWQKTRRNSKSGGRSTSSICTTTPVTASSRWIVQAIDNMPRWMDGKKFFNGLESISANPLRLFPSPLLPLLPEEGDCYSCNRPRPSAQVLHYTLVYGCGARSGPGSHRGRSEVDLSPVHRRTATVPQAARQMS